jgi:hypothetical protein
MFLLIFSTPFFPHRKTFRGSDNKKRNALQYYVADRLAGYSAKNTEKKDIVLVLMDIEDGTTTS